MTQTLLIDLFSEQRFFISNLCTIFGTPGIIWSNQIKNQKIIVQNLSWRSFFQGQVKFLKSAIWFQFYNASNKDIFFDSPGTLDGCFIQLYFHNL